MNYKIFVSVMIFIVLVGCVQIKNEYNRRTKTVQFTQDQICEVLTSLNKEFARYEHENPQKGYCVTIETSSILSAKITPYGGKRMENSLSGVPDDELNYKQKCPFCHYVHDEFVDSHIVKIFNDQSYAVTSLSNQILVIPKKHYIHLFATPLEMQVIILKNILAIRAEHSQNIQRPIEFHCGSAAGQTVFHLHGRTGVYIK